MGLFCCMELVPLLPKVDIKMSFDSPASTQDGVPEIGFILMPEITKN